MTHPTVDARTLLHILAAVQEGECTKRRALECVEAALAGTFTDDWLPAPEGYFGEDEVPIEVVKALRAQGAAGTSPKAAQASDDAALLHGFDREDLDAVAAGLEALPGTINVGNVTGVGDEHIPSTAAVAAQFIRAALRAGPAPLAPMLHVFNGAVPSGHVLVPKVAPAGVIESICAASTLSRWPGDFAALAQEIRRAQARAAYAAVTAGAVVWMQGAAGPAAATKRCATPANAR